jgi:hypothetical protein
MQHLHCNTLVHACLVEYIVRYASILHVHTNDSGQHVLDSTPWQGAVQCDPPAQVQHMQTARNWRQAGCIVGRQLTVPEAQFPKGMIRRVHPRDAAWVLPAHQNSKLLLPVRRSRAAGCSAPAGVKHLLCTDTLQARACSQLSGVVGPVM